MFRDGWAATSGKWMPGVGNTVSQNNIEEFLLRQYCNERNCTCCRFGSLKVLTDHSNRVARVGLFDP